MRIEIIEERAHVSGHHFTQKALRTEIVTDGCAPIQPTDITIYRVQERTGVFRGPNGEYWSYDELLQHHKDQGVKFPGTYHFLEAMDIEFWHDVGDDGHILWVYKMAYRVFIHPEADDDARPWEFVGSVAGNILMRMLDEAVWELTRKNERN